MICTLASKLLTSWCNHDILIFILTDISTFCSLGPHGDDARRPRRSVAVWSQQRRDVPAESHLPAGEAAGVTQTSGDEGQCGESLSLIAHQVTLTFQTHLTDSPVSPGERHLLRSKDHVTRCAQVRRRHRAEPGHRRHNDERRGHLHRWAVFPGEATWWFECVSSSLSCDDLFIYHPCLMASLINQSDE